MAGYGFTTERLFWDAGDVDNGDVICPFCDRPCSGDRCMAWVYDSQEAGRGYCVRMMAELENASTLKYQERSEFHFELGLAFHDDKDARKLDCPYADRQCAAGNCGAWGVHHGEVGYCSRFVAEITTAEIDYDETEMLSGSSAIVSASSEYNTNPF